MYCEHEKAKWDHTSNICAVLQNVMSTKKGKGKSGDDLNPWLKKGKRSTASFRLDTDFEAMKALARG